MPVELHDLEDRLVDQYLCNFSVFQSMLHHWAIDQPFPIVPLHRLNERPGRRALLVDLTCDSDGKVSRSVSSNEDKSFLELHALEPGEPYLLGFFLMGAVQRSHAIANGCFVVAVNRTGFEPDPAGQGGIEFGGQSFVAAPDGRVLCRAPADEACVRVGEVDLDEMRSMRHGWPFFRDRRIDAYGDITERYLDRD